MSDQNQIFVEGSIVELPNDPEMYCLIGAENRGVDGVWYIVSKLYLASAGTFSINYSTWKIVRDISLVKTVTVDGKTLSIGDVVYDKAYGLLEATDIIVSFFVSLKKGYMPRIQGKGNTLTGKMISNLEKITKKQIINIKKQEVSLVEDKYKPILEKYFKDSVLFDREERLIL